MSETVKLKYYIGRRCDEIDWISTSNIIWNMYGICVFSIEEQWARDLVTLPRSFEEVSEELGRWGTKHFGEVRTKVKVTSEDPLSSENIMGGMDEGDVKLGSTGKTVITLPQERIDAAIEFMKVAAKLIIEDQYDRKFLSLKSRESKLEQFLWEAQVRESNNLDGETPVIDSIVAAKGSKKEDVAAGILAGSAAFKEKVVVLYAEMLKIKQKFTKCATIEELNILYQTYMGVPVPNSQAVTLGQVHEEGEYLTQDDVDPGLHI
tara:strand:+ start:39 stop:827 length:789 start_codon:yes stop_codon:yes gene_type:complete